MCGQQEITGIAVHTANETSISYPCEGHSQNHKISLPQHDFHDFPGTGLHSLNPRVKFEGEGGRGDNPPSLKGKGFVPLGFP